MNAMCSMMVPTNLTDEDSHSLPRDIIIDHHSNKLSKIGQSVVCSLVIAQLFQVQVMTWASSMDAGYEFPEVQRSVLFLLGYSENVWLMHFDASNTLANHPRV